MSRSDDANEIERSTEGSGTFRTFGPPSPSSARVSGGLRRTIYPLVANWRPTRRGIAIGRIALERLSVAPPMRGTQIERRPLGGVPVEWTVSPRAQTAGPRTRVLLYCHGGGYVVGSPRVYRNLTSRLSQVLAAPVASVDYRMAPEVGIRESFADCLAAYRGLLDMGYPAEAIAVAGDSAGGGLAAGTCLAAADAGLPLPCALVLLSPWLDLANTVDSRSRSFGTEAFIGGRVLERISAALLPDAASRFDWRVSPFHAPNELLHQLPPTLIQVGGAEVLQDDGIEFAHRMARAGGRVELELFQGQGHVTALWSGIPEAGQALKEIAAWIREALPESREPAPPTDAEIEEITRGRDGLGPEDLLR